MKKLPYLQALKDIFDDGFGFISLLCFLAAFSVGWLFADFLRWLFG